MMFIGVCIACGYLWYQVPKLSLALKFTERNNILSLVGILCRTKAEFSTQKAELSHNALGEKAELKPNNPMKHFEAEHGRFEAEQRAVDPRPEPKMAEYQSIFP